MQSPVPGEEQPLPPAHVGRHLAEKEPDRKGSRDPGRHQVEYELEVCP